MYSFPTSPKPVIYVIGSGGSENTPIQPTQPGEQIPENYGEVELEPCMFIQSLSKTGPISVLFGLHESMKSLYCLILFE